MEELTPSFTVFPVCDLTTSSFDFPFWKMGIGIPFSRETEELPGPIPAHRKHP